MKFDSLSASRSKFWRGIGLAAFISLTGSVAMAQATPGVTLACPTPTSTGVTVDLSTGGAWEIQAPGGGAWNNAAAASNSAWVALPGAAWIGDGATGALGDWGYRVRIDASDPNIDLSSATLSFSYRADNTMLSASLGSTSLNVLPAATHNGPSATSGGPIATPLASGTNYLTALVNNEPPNANPYGLAMQASLTFNCRAAPAVAVPANAPWALVGMGGLLALGAAFANRRRKRS